MATAAPTKRATARTASEKEAAVVSILADVKSMLAKYAPPFQVRTDEWGGYHLWSVKPVVIDGHKKKEVYFAGVIPRRDYVGFYYMPVYADVHVKELFKPELLALLKGRSCFHLKRDDAAVAKQIKSALADGFRMYKKRGWV